MTRLLPVLAMAALTLMQAAGPAAAHKLRVFATVVGTEIKGRVYFVGGGAAIGVPVTLRDSTGVVTGQTASVAPGGTFALALPFRDDFTILADAQDGHAADFPISAGRLPTNLPASGHDPAAQVPAPVPAATVPTSDLSAVEDAVARQLAPLAEMIDEMRAEVRMRDMLGGAGYVPGSLASGPCSHGAAHERRSPCPCAFRGTARGPLSRDVRPPDPAGRLPWLPLLDRPGALALALAAGLVAVVLARLPARAVLARLLVTEGFLVALLVTFPFLLPGRPIFSILGFPASWEGLAQAIVIVLRINVAVLMTMALLDGLGSAGIARAMTGLGLPPRLGHLMQMTVRYIGLFDGEYHRLRRAMRARGQQPPQLADLGQPDGHVAGAQLRTCRTGARGDGLPRLFRPFPDGGGTCADCRRSRPCRPGGIADGGPDRIGMPVMPVPLIRVANLSAGYPGQIVLRQVDFDLYPGERLAVLGQNGAGKSTLLRALVGLVPSLGRIEAFGHLCRTEADFHAMRLRAGLVFQNPDDQLFCPSVIEDVAFGPLNMGQSQAEARATAQATLHDLGLGAYADRITHRLSGGEKRLISVATVLAMKPEVLLLDEPTTGLDDAAYERLCALLSGLPQAMIIVAHEERFVSRLASRAILLKDGRSFPGRIEEHFPPLRHAHLRVPGQKAADHR